MPTQHGNLGRVAPESTPLTIVLHRADGVWGHMEAPLGRLIIARQDCGPSVARLSNFLESQKLGDLCKITFMFWKLI